MTQQTEAPAPERYEYAPIDAIHPSKTNPRKHFPPESLDELAASIQAHGIIEPLIVTDRGTEGYEIYAGERRYRAAKIIGLATVPVIVRAIDNGEAAVVRLVENIQREDLSPLDLAAGYEQLVKKHGKTVDEVADMVHKSRRSVYATMALLKLNPEVKKALQSGAISPTVATFVSPLPPIHQAAAMNEILRLPLGASVRVAQEIVEKFDKRGEEKKVERAKREVKKATAKVKETKKKLASAADKKREGEKAIEQAALVIVTRRVHEHLTADRLSFDVRAHLLPLCIRAGAMLDYAFGWPEAFAKARNIDVSTTAKAKRYLANLKDDDVFSVWLEITVAEEYGGVEESALNAILKYVGLPKYGEMLKEARKQAAPGWRLPGTEPKTPKKVK
jgi:ParB family chromosome partitioning protein